MLCTAVSAPFAVFSLIPNLRACVLIIVLVIHGLPLDSDRSVEHVMRMLELTFWSNINLYSLISSYCTMVLFLQVLGAAIE